MLDSVNEGFRRDEENAGLLTRIRRRKVLFGSVFLGVIAVTAAIYVVLPPKYLATGSMILTSPVTEVSGDTLSPAAEQKLGDPADIDGQVLILKSPRVARAMLQHPEMVAAVYKDCEQSQGAGLVSKIKKLVGLHSSCSDTLAGNQILDWIGDRFAIGAAGRSRVFQIAYESRSPQVAVTLVNGLIDAYLEQGIADKQRPRAVAEAWLQSQLDTLGEQVRQSDLQLDKFRRDHGLVRGQTAAIASERLTEVSQQLATAEAAASDASARLGQTRNGADDVRDTLESRSVADLKQQLSEVSGNLAVMSSSHGSDYPEEVALEQQRRELQSRIGEETGRVRSSLESDYASATAQVDTLRKELDSLKQDVSAGDYGEAQIAGMERDADIKRAMYIDMSKQVSDIEAQRRLVTGDAELISYAEIPTKVYFPKLPLFAMAGLFMASILASAAALIRDRSDNTVRTSARLEALASTRVLGVLPHVRLPTSAYMSKGDTQLTRPSALQEAIRVLFARCILLAGPNRPQTLMLTSANSQEGKTFLTLAMAQFGAAAGKRVLAIEADLRQPGFRTALGLAHATGLTELLRGTADYAGVIHKTDFGFDLIFGGAPTVASTELLSNGKIGALLEWARERYDLILVDTPPAQFLMDAQVLASSVDAVLYCARWGYSSVDSVLAGVENLRRAGGHVMGLVIGMVKPQEYGWYEPAKLPRRTYLMAPT